MASVDNRKRSAAWLVQRALTAHRTEQAAAVITSAAESRLMPSPLIAPNDFPFPTEADSEFPRRRYRTRRGEPKSAVHWGQRKLLLSEIQLLCEALEANGINTKFTIVYAGSAPGTHLKLLDDLFPGHQWHLIDPMPFDVENLGSLPNFRLRNEYFTCGTASEYVVARMQNGGCPALAQVFACMTELDSFNRRVEVKSEANLVDGVEATGETATPVESLPRGIALLSRVAAARSPLLFVCDIRSGSVTQLNPQAVEGGEAATFRGVEFEQHVRADMNAQMLWVEYLQPTFAMLKFRLPYMEIYHPATKELVHRHPSETTPYLKGRVLLPIWTRPTSTECRLLVPEGAGRVEYNNRGYEEQLFFFNSIVRERVFFPHSVDAKQETYLDHRYDGAAEVLLLQRYLRLTGRDTNDATAIVSLSSRVSAFLGKTFAEAANRLPNVVMRKASDRGFADGMRALVEAAEGYRRAPCWWSVPTQHGVPDPLPEGIELTHAWSWLRSA